MIMIAMRLKIIEDKADDRLIMKIEDHLNEIISTLLLIFKLECKEAKKRNILLPPKLQRRGLVFKGKWVTTNRL